ncbi:unnamed protein product [Camellia sinensis]
MARNSSKLPEINGDKPFFSNNSHELWLSGSVVGLPASERIIFITSQICNSRKKYPNHSKRESYSKGHLRQDLRFYLKQIPSKVAIIHDNLFVEVLRPYTTTDTNNVEHRVVYSISKPVPLLAVQENENNERSIISCRSFPTSISSMESSDMLKNSLASSFAHRSREHSFSSGDFGSTSKQEKSA